MLCSSLFARPLRIALLVLAAALLASCQATPYREVEVDLEAGAGHPGGADGPRAGPTLRFAVAAMESPRDTYAGYSKLLARLGHELETHVDLVQRRTYQEVNDLLTSGGLDAALVCTGGYLDLRRRAPGSFEVLAVPVIDGKTTYQSLVIVPAASPASRLEDLEGKRFAFTDELSFSGRAYIVSRLRGMGRAPDEYFASTLYTHSHDRSIKAVADELVDGAVVHSVIYNHRLALEPSLGDKTRIVGRSAPFGMMPIVVSTRVPEAERARIRRALLDLGHDPAAAEAMRSLRIDKFEVPSPGLYDSAAAVMASGG